MKKSFISKIGWGFLLLACVCWLLIFIIPFLADGFGETAGLIAIFVIAGEVLFWVGTLLVGKEVLAHYKRKWFDKSKKSDKID